MSPGIVMMPTSAAQSYNSQEETTDLIVLFVANTTIKAENPGVADQR